MMESGRRDAAPRARGKLKIFLGYAPGVGTTYAMLSAGLEEGKGGADVAVGVADGRGRPETEALLAGLKRIPALGLGEAKEGAGELHLDLALQRRPELILVDDLAHANRPGVRHKKRYQDVEELLRAGIDVYTTLDVRQIESLTDIAASISGAAAQERVPDHVLESADQIKLVDLDPGDLIERLRQGKLGSSRAEAADGPGLYTRERLTALREIALRCTARQLNRIAIQISDQARKSDYGTKEHILVGLSSAASNQKVIRTAARMAEAFHGRFTALYVETPATVAASARDKELLRSNLRLAEQLGAQVATVYGEDIPGQIAEYVKAGGVSKIVLGRSPGRRRWAKGSVVDRLTALVPAVETYVIPYTNTAPRRNLRRRTGPKLSPADLARTAAILAVCTGIGFVFQHWEMKDANIITVYILGVLLNAMVTKGRLYSVASSVLSVLVFNYFFTAPYFSLRAYDSGYPVTFAVMLVSSFLTSTLTTRVRQQARQSAQKAYRTEVLLETSRKLQQAGDIPGILEETARQLVKLLDRTVILYAAGEKGLSEPMIFTKPDGGPLPGGYTDENERAVADWVYKNDKRAGATTDTFFGARGLYHAVRGGGQVMAVAAVVMDGEEPLGVFERSLMTALLGESALALEKERLNERQREIVMQIRQEQLRANLLRGISHDLRTPLTSISGNAGILVGNSRVLTEEQKQSLYTDIYDDSMWLISLVENLLSISRIENGSINLNLQAELVEEVAAEALLHLSRNRDKHVIRTEIEGDLLLARMDSRLIVQVLINLLDNAIKYTQEGSHITLSARRQGAMVEIEVADDGPGVPDEAKLRLFEMFYTADNVRGDGRRGLGLGLSLCKSIVNAHGGIIGVRDRMPRGTVFYLTLQAAEVNRYE